MPGDFINVLIVEDNPGDLRLAVEMLRKGRGARVTAAASLAECLERLAEGAIEVVLLDLGLPDSQGLDTLKAVIGARPSAAVIAVTGLDDDRTALAAVQMGAQDYVTKGRLTSDVLPRAVRYALERKRVKNALADSERKWRNVLANTPQIGIGLSPQGTITFANDYFLKLTGWTLEEVLDREWFATCVPAEIRDEIRTVFRRTMEMTDVLGYTTHENPIITRKGERREVSWANVLTRDADGSIVDVTCLGVDLTDRLRAETAIRASEERLNLVLRSTNDGWWDMDLPTGAIFASPRWWEMIGYQTHEMPSARETWERLTHPDDIARVKEAVNQAIASGAVTFEVESRRKHKDGRWLPILTRGFITRDHDGAARRVTGTAADLTELKRSEEQLRDALARFESVVNLSPIVAIQGYDRDGTIRQWNHASERLYGYDAATAIGAKVNELLGEDEASGCQSTIRRVWDQAAPSEPTEWELPTASGQKRWVYSCMFPLFDKGVVTMVCCMDIDITDRKRAEAEAERQLDELRRWQAVTVGREERIMELRREVNDLARRLGAPAPYPEQRSGPPAP